MQEDRTPVWPRYIPKNRERTLWVQLGNGRWLSEYGEIETADTAESFVDLLFRTNGQAFCGAVEILPWFQEAIAESHMGGPGASATQSMASQQATAFLSELSVHPRDLTPLQITFKRKWPNSRGRVVWQTRKVTATTVWGVPCTPELLPRLRWLFETLDTGVHPTPGSTGAHRIAAEWSKHAGEEWPRHHRPHLQLVQALQEHAIGSRKEAYSPDEVFDLAFEADMTNGFAAQADVLPAGTPGYLGGNSAQRILLPLVGDSEAQRTASIRHWWGRCYVRVWRDLPMGDVAPFAVRDSETGELSWLTREGGYWTYLWNFEADEIQRRYREDGCMQILAIEWAWAWEWETTQLAGWAEAMDHIRNATQYGELSGVDDPDEKKLRAGLVKLCIVAGIGRLGVPYEKLTVIPEDQAQEGDIELHSERVPYLGLFARREWSDMGTPMHWHKYILSRMNYAIYERLRYNYTHGLRNIGCNVDGVTSVEMPPDYTAAKRAAMGGYKFNDYDVYAMTAPGSILARERETGKVKIALPGVPERVRSSIANGQQIKQQLRRLGEQRTIESRSEILFEQGKRVFLTRMHELAQERAGQWQEEQHEQQRQLERLEQLWSYTEQRKYWNRIAGNE